MKEQIRQIIEASIKTGEDLERLNPASREKVKQITIEIYSGVVSQATERQTMAIIEFCQANHTAQWFYTSSPYHILKEYEHRIEERYKVNQIPEDIKKYIFPINEAFEKIATQQLNEAMTEEQDKELDQIFDDLTTKGMAMTKKHKK